MRPTLAAFVLFLSWGCATVRYGERIDPDDVMNIERCVTSEQDLVDVFGEPLRTGVQSGYGTQTWSYADLQVSAFSSTSRNIEEAQKNTGLLTSFVNAEGIVVDYAYNYSESVLVQIVDNCGSN